MVSIAPSSIQGVYGGYKWPQLWWYLKRTIKIYMYP